FRQASREGKQRRIGEIFAKRNKMDFVVAGRPVAARADPYRGVEHRRSLPTRTRGGCGYNRSGNRPRCSAAGYLADRIAKSPVIGGERSGRLRPDDQIDLRQRVAGGRLHGEFLEFVQRLLQGGGIPFGRDRNILLHEKSRVIGLRRWSVDQSSRLQDRG